MIEQFGVRGLFAHLPEIIRRRDEAASEEVLPDAIGHDARGKWVVAPRDFAREGEASAVGRAERGAAEHLEEAARDGRGGL
jgi:hypothetical protein